MLFQLSTQFCRGSRLAYYMSFDSAMLNMNDSVNAISS